MLRFTATRVEKDDAWVWEAWSPAAHRLHFEVTRGGLPELVRDIRRWYGLVFCRSIESECECGGTSAGFPAFGAGHRHWCPAGPVALDLVLA